MINIFYSPLEQFQVIYIFGFNLGSLDNYTSFLINYDLSITTVTVVIFSLLYLIYVESFLMLKSKSEGLFVIPTKAQAAFELFYLFILSLVVDNIKGKEAIRFFPLIFTIFVYIAALGLIGLLPYGFTVTAHIVSVLAISLTCFIGMNIILFNKHGLKAFSMFVPEGTPFLLALLLVPVEFILYLFRPLSLTIRLFCNMLAGHVLLKILAAFFFYILTFPGVFMIVSILPLIVILLIFVLELAVCLIQAFVFSLLISMYINDVLNLH